MDHSSAPNVIPVILSGGSGSRLWPKSRKAYPKQLHKLYDEYTMLQHTFNRVNHLAAPIIVCNDAQRFMVADQLSEVSDQKISIMLEPVGRNTAPAIAVAALKAMETDSNAILVVLPADHQIKDSGSFKSALDLAVEKARSGKLVAFGIVPSHPETGYGYINSLAEQSAGAEVLKFVEKPDQDTAQSYVSSGEYFWNSGMFVFSAKTYIEELSRFEPEMVKSCSDSLSSAQSDLDFIRLDQESFSKAKDISIDYAVMEKTELAWCIPLSCGWSDLGSWQSLWENTEKDESGNVTQGDVYSLDCENTLLQSEKKLIVGIGLKNVAIVESDDAILAVNLNQTQDVKKVVDWLKSEGRGEFNFHREVHRPWGCYDSIDNGGRYQVKRIEVRPGASLSLQMHHHRAEHWVVVSGTALVQKGEEEVLLSENQSVYIPLGEKHRLTNPGKVPLQIIEVQSGSYLGEDDIVRYEDKFGRS
ncbi:MAG: mannose-1-phosphate guanylyltransferase/mannose-6-phosphate isomerase [Agarilytica sp.]